MLCTYMCMAVCVFVCVCVCVCVCVHCVHVCVPVNLSLSCISDVTSLAHEHSFFFSELIMTLSHVHCLSSLSPHL